jgi:hypothetical protein
MLIVFLLLICKSHLLFVEIILADVGEGQSQRRAFAMRLYQGRSEIAMTVVFCVVVDLNRTIWQNNSVFARPVGMATSA